MQQQYVYILVISISLFVLFSLLLSYFCNTNKNNRVYQPLINRQNGSSNLKRTNSLPSLLNRNMKVDFLNESINKNIEDAENSFDCSYSNNNSKEGIYPKLEDLN